VSPTAAAGHCGKDKMGKVKKLVSNFISLRFPLTCPSLASLFKHEHS